MYTCANCGVVFEGKVCPNCCTMRPAAAVLGSGQILKDRSIGAETSPGQRAARLAEDIEQSRRMDALRQEMLRREEQQRRMEEQAKKAANWQRKAPVSRTGEEQEEKVTMPDALRSLKISEDKAEKQVKQVQCHSRVMTRVKEGKSVNSYPSVASIPPRRGGRGLSSAPSERIDAAWRVFARGSEEDNGSKPPKENQ